MGVLMSVQEDFYVFLKSVDCSEVEIYAMPEGSVVFPRVPLMRVEGPLLVSFFSLFAHAIIQNTCQQTGLVLNLTSLEKFFRRIDLILITYAIRICRKLKERCSS